MKFRRYVLRQKFVATAALLVVASVGVTLITHNTLAGAWSQATTRQPERYTALSFLDTGHLPTYTKPNVIQRVTFRLTNHQSAQTTYEYRALLNTAVNSTLIKSGVVTLEDGQSIDEVLNFALPDVDMSGQIMVQLVNRSEYITFEVKS